MDVPRSFSGIENKIPQKKTPKKKKKNAGSMLAAIFFSTPH